METRDRVKHGVTRVPVVCRACGSVQRVPVTVIRGNRGDACRVCERPLDLATVAAALPTRVGVEESPFSVPRPLSEFP